MTDPEQSEFEQALARTIGAVLRQLYPQNPDVVLGREARIIAEAIVPLGWTPHAWGNVFRNTERDRLAWRERAWKAEAENERLRELLGEVVDWLGVPDWTGPQLPAYLARRIAGALPGAGPGGPA